ncbi:hypothetical protein Trydic_g19616 [Trypoxylus dichotomus]
MGRRPAGYVHRRRDRQRSCHRLRVEGAFRKDSRLCIASRVAYRSGRGWRHVDDKKHPSRTVKKHIITQLVTDLSLCLLDLSVKSLGWSDLCKTSISPSENPSDLATD